MIGEKAPDFRLIDQFENEFHLYDNIGKPILIVFYPKDESFVCTKQLCDYNFNYNKFIEKGIVVVAIGSDDVKSHLQFSEKHNFYFPLLSDIEKRVAQLYSAVSILGTIKRKTVFIDSEGIIRFEDDRFPLFYLKPENLLHILETVK